MAVPRPQYLEHVYRALGHGLAQQPALVETLLPGWEDYVAHGNFQTEAMRQEALETLLNKIWKDVYGKPYHGHEMKHAFHTAQDVSDIQEPV